MRELGDRIAALDKQSLDAGAARDQLMLRLPNLPHESVKAGKTAEDNPVVRFMVRRRLSPSNRSRMSNFANRSSW